jgi:multiple sugar transport system substrate-binding protein
MQGFKVPTKALTAVALVLLLTGVAFGEGQAEAGGEAAGGGQPEELNLIMGDWAGPVLDGFFEEYAERTGIEINYEGYPFRELFETIEIRQQAGSSDVDLFFVDAPVTANYAEKGYMLPAGEYFTEDELSNTWAENSARAGFYNDTFYAAPLNNSSQVLYYNRDLLEEAGVEFPSTDVEDRWTWEELVEAAQQVDALGDDIWGFAFDQINRYYQLQVLPESLGGGDGISADGSSAELTTPEWIEAFTWYGNLFNEWEISPKGVAPIEVPERFAAGKIGFFVGGLWNISGYFQNAEGLDYAVAPHPYFGDGEPATPTLSWHVGIWSNTEYADAAGELLNWLTTNPEIGEYWLENWGQFPARLEVLDTILEDDKYAEQPFIGYRIASYEVQNTAISRAKTPAFLEFEEILNNSFEDIRNGADPEEALSQAEGQINRALRRYQ